MANISIHKAKGKDNKTHLSLLHYAGSTREIILDENNQPVLYTTGKMQGKPKYQIKHCRKYTSLDMWIYSKCITPEQKEYNNSILNLANQKLREAELRLLQGKGNILPTANNIEILSQWQTKHICDYYAKQCVIKYLKSDVLYISTITHDFMTDFADYLNSLNCVSAYRYWRCFINYLQQYIDDGLLAVSVIKNIKCINRATTDIKKSMLSLAELKLIENAKSNDIRVKAFLFACYTGLRISDIRRITWDNIDFNNNLLSFVQYKIRRCNNAYLQVPLCSKALDILSTLDNNNALIFGNISKHFSEYFDKFIKSLGINKHISFHCARHSFASNLLNNGIDLIYVSKLCGHSKIDMTAKYITTKHTEKVKAIKIFDN